MQFETFYVNYILDVPLLLNDTDTIARCIDIKVLFTLSIILHNVLCLIKGYKIVQEKPGVSSSAQNFSKFKF